MIVPPYRYFEKYTAVNTAPVRMCTMLLMYFIVDVPVLRSIQQYSQEHLDFPFCLCLL